MGFFSAELESMVELYQRETAELMEEFDTRLTGAMQQNRFSAEDIHAVFRVVHTIKSSAAMMGLQDISSCTHRMEDLFLLFRDRPERAYGHENRVFDLMFSFSDYIETENRRISQKDFQPEHAAGLLEAIDAEIKFFGAEDKIEEEKKDIEIQKKPEKEIRPEEKIPAPALGETVFLVKLHENCQMENVRAFMLVRQIQDICGKISTVPPNLEAPDAALLIAKNGFLLYLHTSQPENVKKRLLSSPYVMSVEKREENFSSEQAENKDDSGGDTAAAENGTHAGRQNKFSMVSWSHVTALQNVTGELITANTILGASIKKFAKDGKLENEFQTMQRLFHDLEKLVAAVSMMPVFSAMPQYFRLVRDVAAREEKQIRLKVTGEELEIDRNLLDVLANPLIHLLRNAADHGIESPGARIAEGKDPCGTISLKFENLTDRLRVTVQDDGCGMNTRLILEKAAKNGVLTKSEDQYSNSDILNLAFLPGLTTNEKANQYSGRGVGMDVAQSAVSNLGGSITVDSEEGKGTSVIMEVPVSVTSAECIRFLVGVHTCFLPIRSVIRIYSYDEAKANIRAIDGRLFLQTDEVMPVLDMFGLFGVQEGESRRFIVISDIRGKAALLAGPVTGQQTAVEKPLPPILGRNYRKETAVIGCTVTETGKLGIMLSADQLIRMCEKGAQRDGNVQQ